MQYSPAKCFYIALTVHAFKEIICDWVQDIYDCFILHAESLNHEFVPSREKIPFQPLHGSDGELEDSVSSGKNQDAIHLERDDGVTESIVSDEDNYDI